MGRVLDQRSSMNSNATGSISIGVTSDPTDPVNRFGVIGLQTQGVPNPIVNLTGTVGISGPVDATATIQVRRDGTVFYSANIVITTTILPDIRSFTVQDLLAPAADEIVYDAIITSSDGVNRVGPEVFWGIASEG
jgi:hypothetical protein